MAEICKSVEKTDGEGGKSPSPISGTWDHPMKLNVGEIEDCKKNFTFSCSIRIS